MVLYFKYIYLYIDIYIFIYFVITIERVIDQNGPILNLICCKIVNLENKKEIHMTWVKIWP